MVKRKASDASHDSDAVKRLRSSVTTSDEAFPTRADESVNLESTESERSAIDRLSKSSHEIILRVLSFLSAPELILCQHVSRQFRALCGDSQLWKALYYNRFVRPRASRIPGIRDSGVPADSLHFSSKLSKWLGEEGLVKRGRETNWKRQYKLRHNWSKGSCAVSEIQISEQPSVPPILVQMSDSTVILADQRDGLRAWNNQSDRKMLAKADFAHIPDHETSSPPSALAIDSAASVDNNIQVAVGFQNGSFTIYKLDTEVGAFERLYSHPASSNGMLRAIAMSAPYLATMTATQLLSVYKFTTNDWNDEDKPLQPPRLLHSLHSHTVWPPFSLSIRPSAETIMVSIAYALPTYLSGWTVGIQEMRMSVDTGELLSSRLASAVDQHFRPLTFSATPNASPTRSTPDNPFAAFGSSEASQIHTKPTSLSYTHPYLLVSHPDNTLTLYLVSSTTEDLSISPGSRLWGHTSSVSGAYVGGRGKAVSVSSRGDELRLWELEGGFSSAASKRRLQSGGLSVQIRPEKKRRRSSVTKKEAILDAGSIRDSISTRRDGLGIALQHGKADLDEFSMIRGWVGFDEENVVVLKEKSCGGQALVVYDFA